MALKGTEPSLAVNKCYCYCYFFLVFEIIFIALKGTKPTSWY